MAEERKILIAVDESQASQYAFTWAITNFLRKTDHVLVLNAQQYVPASEISQMIDFGGEYAVPVQIGANEEERSRLLFASKIVVDKYQALLASADIPCEGAVVKGPAGDHIVAEAERINATAVIVGTHCYGLLKRTFLGSISDHVIHHASAPVILVRSDKAPGAHDPIGHNGLQRTIVIAVDECKESVFAFTWALSNICAEADKVIILHVQNPALGATPDAFPLDDIYVHMSSSTADDVKLLDSSEKLVEKYMQYAAKESKVNCEGKVVTGPTAETVLAEVVKLQADVVVIGTHKISAVAKTFLGSVSDYLAHHSPCPVVVAKMPAEDLAAASGDQVADKTA
eukprot:TRINITY_DN393_c0_g1_i1.p1 TRINITY_DN393_c0_g1~~TRINITY_DN393_c0_g1_i1.p1  ORF type:complete len:342 (-),score=64.24 TRINITY_DN393_c0_g1_i1:573-1598(-)